MRPISYVIDTGSRLNLLGEDLVDPDWLPSIHPCDNSRLNSLTNQKVEVVGTVVLNVHIGASRISVIFEIVRIPAVPV